MKCPLCQAVNIDGSDLCESCGYDLVETDHEREPDGSLAQNLRAPLAEAGLHDPITLRPNDTVATAVARMSAASWGSVLVVEGDRVAGVFTEQDLLRRIGPDDDQKQEPCKQRDRGSNDDGRRDGNQEVHPERPRADSAVTVHRNGGAVR